MKSSARLVRATGKEKPPKKVHANPPYRSCLYDAKSAFLGLQRAIGNRAMGQLIQAKLTIGAPNDKYEQEADRVAKQVMRMPLSKSAAVVPEEEEKNGSASNQVDRTISYPSPCPSREEKLQTKSELSGGLQLQAKPPVPNVLGVTQIMRAPLGGSRTQCQCLEYEEKLQSGILPCIQTKLTIPEPDNEYEREADRVAEQVMRMPEVQVQRQENPIKLRTKSSSGETQKADTDLESRIDAACGGGQPLPKSTRDFFESRFGHYFGGVRIHADSTADRLNRELNARAFTVRNDIFMREGEYNGVSKQGKILLAHELVHVLQQSSNGASTKFKIGKMCIKEKLCTSCNKNYIQRHPGRPFSGVRRRIFRQVPIDQWSEDEFILAIRQRVSRWVQSRTVVAGQPARREIELTTGNASLRSTYRQAMSAGLTAADIRAKFHYVNDRVERITFSLLRESRPSPRQLRRIPNASFEAWSQARVVGLIISSDDPEQYTLREIAHSLLVRPNSPSTVPRFQNTEQHNIFYIDVIVRPVEIVPRYQSEYRRAWCAVTELCRPSEQPELPVPPRPRPVPPGRRPGRGSESEGEIYGVPSYPDARYWIGGHTTRHDTICHGIYDNQMDTCSGLESRNEMTERIAYEQGYRDYHRAQATGDSALARRSFQLYRRGACPNANAFERAYRRGWEAARSHHCMALRRAGQQCEPIPGMGTPPSDPVCQ